MLKKQLEESKKYLESKTNIKPKYGLILGSGLGGLVDEMQIDKIIDYSDIPNFLVSTAIGHAGRLVFAKLAGQEVVAMQGRFHYYEGYSMQDIVYPVRLMAFMGVETLIVTNAAGGLDPKYAAGDVMLIKDHINMMIQTPLIGPNHDFLGPRFPDMSDAYDKELRKLARAKAAELNIDIQEGVYLGTPGPVFETSAERRFQHLIGANAVGMSTVPEVIAAKHAGLKVLGFSAITNVATGADDQPADDSDEVIEVANVIGPKIVKIISAVIRNKT